MMNCETTAKAKHISVPGGRVWMLQCGSGPGLPVVLLNGGPGSPHDYLKPLEDLGDAREVVFYDQLGCGRSDQPDDPRLWTLPRFVEELRAVIAEVGSTPVHLLGHSWGAMLAVEYALACPEQVASLVLDSPSLSMRRVRADMEKLKADMPEAVRRVIEECEATGETDSGAYSIATMAFYHRHVCRQPEWPEPLVASQASWGWQVYRTMWGPSEFTPVGNLSGYEREQQLRQLACPVLYLCGRYDEITPESTEAYHRQTPGSEFVIFENSAHVKHLEEPQHYLAVVRNFLHKVDSLKV